MVGGRGAGTSPPWWDGETLAHLLDCPASQSILRAIFGTIFDLWPRPWGGSRRNFSASPSVGRGRVASPPRCNHCITAQMINLLKVDCGSIFRRIVHNVHDIFFSFFKVDRIWMKCCSHDLFQPFFYNLDMASCSRNKSSTKVSLFA